jgi:hypothetical protein
LSARLQPSGRAARFAARLLYTPAMRPIRLAALRAPATILRACLAPAITLVVLLSPALVAASISQDAARPQVGMVDTPTVKVLRGLTVPEFEAEMQAMTTALGVSCGFCHTRGNFASDANPKKLVARRMLEMTKLVNQQFFADYKPPDTPPDGDSRLGRVTCFTCHQGNERPKATP